MTFRSLIATGGSASFSRAELQAERPTLGELILAFIAAQHQGDDQRAAAYRETAVRRFTDDQKEAA